MGRTYLASHGERYDHASLIVLGSFHRFAALHLGPCHPLYPDRFIGHDWGCSVDGVVYPHRDACNASLRSVA